MRVPAMEWDAQRPVTLPGLMSEQRETRRLIMAFIWCAGDAGGIELGDPQSLQCTLPSVTFRDDPERTGLVY
jgi:hypothetical protein